MEAPLLSILIPTFNRSRFLHSCLLSIFNQIEEGYEVEVIVSNNKSTDNTEEIINFFSSKSKFIYYNQPENLGAIKNILKLVNEYASGKFCWIVGDDDFVLQNSIASILSLIKKETDVEYFYAKVGHMHIKEYTTYQEPFDTSMMPLLGNKKITYRRVEKFEELISPEYSIVFLGELMASIFKRDVWMEYQISNIEYPYLSTLETSYPHSVIFANTFIGRKAVYIQSEMVIALDGIREWWDKVGYIIVVHLRALLDLYRTKGVSSLIMYKAFNHYINISKPYIGQFFLNPLNPNRKKISFKSFFCLMFKYRPLQACGFFLKLVLKLVKKSISNRIRYFRNAKIETIEGRGFFDKNGVVCGEGEKIYGQPFIINNGEITIGKNFTINAGINENPIGGDITSRLITHKKNAKLIIGNNVGISNSTIVCWNKIEIGDNVLIGGGVRIWDTNFHSLDFNIRTSSYDYDIKTAPIKISDNVFIGAGSIILKGVSIGVNSIIAAGSVVTKEIPDNVIAGGNPCVVIKQIT